LVKESLERPRTPIDGNPGTYTSEDSQSPRAELDPASESFVEAQVLYTVEENINLGSRARDFRSDEDNESLWCDRCDGRITGRFHHCLICRDDDFDLCQICVQDGRHCYNNQHRMLKVVIRCGEIVELPGEFLSPKASGLVFNSKTMENSFLERYTGSIKQDN